MTAGSKVIRVDQDDMEMNALERVLGEWALEFLTKSEGLCLRLPRFSELRASSLRQYL